MRNMRKFLFTAVAIAVMLTGIMPPAAKAQLDVGSRFYLYENGVRVGEIYVPDRAEGQSEYLEHWVLYPNYMYPGPRFIGALQIVPSPTEKPYASESDFFRNVPFAPGSKYIRVLAQEYSYLPATR